MQELCDRLQAANDAAASLPVDKSKWRGTTIQSFDAARSLQWFFNFVGFGGDMLMGAINAAYCAPGEVAHEFCTTTQAYINGSWHSPPVLPKAAILALASPEMRGDLGLRRAKALSLAALVPKCAK